ncbi:MAG: UDP-N-acetylmuramoyl-L-alanine--D-glutamate ligase [Thermoanaerobaculia bacterium]
MKTPWSQHEWRRAAIYGLGASGRAAARLLADCGVAVLGIDDGEPSPEVRRELSALPEVELVTGGAPPQLPEDVDGLVLSPGVPPDRPLVAAARTAGVPVIGEVELAFPFLDGPVVAITGSNGKSTTTALTGALLAACGYPVEVCGNIGLPLAARVAGPAGRVFVVELSSFQLETVVTFRARAAALLNITADHLDRYRGMDAYAAAKRGVFARQEPGDVAVLNADDPRVRDIRVGSRRRLFSRRGPVDDGCYLDGARVLEVAPGAGPVELFACSQVPVPGVHNLENAMAAALLARAVGAELDCLRRGLTGFRGLAHRLELAGERGGVRYFDDSKATNIDAARASLEGFADGSVHLILGGRGKGTDPRELVPMVERKARRVYLIGESAPELAATLEGRVAYEHAGTLDRALAAAAAVAATGDVVLLSPACASFDQYRNFAERGDHFQALVRALMEEGA